MPVPKDNPCLIILGVDIYTGGVLGSQLLDKRTIAHLYNMLARFWEHKWGVGPFWKILEATQVC